MSDFLAKLLAAAGVQQPAPMQRPSEALGAPARADDQGQLQAWLAEKQNTYERAGADPKQIAEWQKFNQQRYEEALRQKREAEMRAALPGSVIQGMLAR